MNNIATIIANNEEALKRQSRSFSLPILRMDPSFKLPIMAQYNLCKTIDTIEDSIEINPDEKIDLINEVCSELKQNKFSKHVLKEMVRITPEDESYVFKHYDSIVALFNTLSASEQKLGLKYLDEMALGMGIFVKKDISTAEDLNQYCYYVAGTVGVYLSELLQNLSSKTDDKLQQQMMKDGVHFGLFLQKLNIIRDYRSDSLIRQRHFWPSEYFKNDASLVDILNIMCAETIFNDIGPAIRYCQSIPAGNDSFDFFIRYILKSGIKYMLMLRGNFMIFFMDNIKLDRSFINDLYDDVANQSCHDFLYDLDTDYFLLKDCYQSEKEGKSSVYA